MTGSGMVGTEYRYCAGESPLEHDRYLDAADRIEAAAAQLRQYRIEDPVSQHYSIGFYDGVEHSLSVIEQALKA